MNHALARPLTGMPEPHGQTSAEAEIRQNSHKDRCRCALLRNTSNELSISSKMAEQLSREERLKLIYQNLQEILKPDIIEQVVLKEDRPLKIYWGMARLDHRICCNR